MKGKLILADGTTFNGELFGYIQGEISGQVDFTAIMEGFGNALTDPTYKGKILVMAYPLVGNYGIPEAEIENKTATISGLVVSSRCKHPHHYLPTMALDDYLHKNKIVGLAGVDTRALVRHIRDRGAVWGTITSLQSSVTSQQA